MTGEELVVRSEPRPGVVQLTLSRPGQLNALTWPLVDALHGQSGTSPPA
jgi:enoyl-CoA hydratase/carnithine racemase